MRKLLVIAMVCWGRLAFASGQPPQNSGRQLGPHAQLPTQATQDDKRGTDETPLVVKNYPQTTPNGAVEAEEDRREKASTDRWTIRIGEGSIAVSFLTFLILIGQTIVFGRQAKRLKETVSEMQKVTPATEKAADAAKKAADVAEATLVTTSRPWLHIESKITEFIISDTGIQVEAKFTCLNAGKSPATYAARHIRIYRMPIPANEVRATILRDFADIPEETHFGEAAFPGFEFRESAYINDPNIARNDGKAPYYLLCGISYIFDFGERIRHFSIEGILVERVSETVGNNRTNGFKFTSLGVYSD